MQDMGPRMQVYFVLSVWNNVLVLLKGSNTHLTTKGCYDTCTSS